jgi:acyl-CoA synthetase (AMP-forming)/AMP-acid ligase II
MITGRSKEVIILANGKNVYPEELEAHYGHSTWIKEALRDGHLQSGRRAAARRSCSDMDEFRPAPARRATTIRRT